MLFILLIRMRLSSAVNVIKDTAKRSPWLAAGLTILGIGLFSAIYLGFLFIYHLSGQIGSLSETAYQTFYFLFLFLLAGAVPFVASTLLHSADYTLLFSAPIPSRVVVAAKLLDATVTNSLQFSVLGIPAMVACAASFQVGLYGWLLLPVAVFLFVLLPALLTAFGVLLMLWIIGVKRLRSAVTAMNVLMAAIVCVTIVVEASHLPIKQGTDLYTIQSATLSRSSPAAHLFPTAWFCDLLISSRGSDANSARSAVVTLGKIALLVGGLFASCLLLGGRLLTAANIAEESGSEMVNTGTDSSDLWMHLFSAPVAALLVKDWKYLRRDSVLLSQLTMPLILFAVPFLLALQDAHPEQRGDVFTFSSVVIGIIVFMQTSILSLSSIGLENRSFWVVLTSPNGGNRLLYAKFLLSTLFASAVGITLTLVSGVAFNGGRLVVLVQILVVVASSAALSGLGVGLSAIFPRFSYENPAQRVSAWAMILGFVASTTYVLISGILFATAWLLTVNPMGENRTILIYSIVSLLYLSLTLSVIFMPLAMGARRIESYQWEY